MLGTARVALVVAAAGCGASCGSAGPAVVVVPVGMERPTTDAAVAFAEVVATQTARQRGLMGRERLERDHGMLFVYPRSQARRFWMKDCLIGLDIAFVAEDGLIARLATLGPGVGAPAGDVPEAECDAPVRYVLEMEAGWFARHGVREGDRADVRAATDGVRAE